MLDLDHVSTIVLNFLLNLLRFFAYFRLPCQFSQVNLDLFAKDEEVKPEEIRKNYLENFSLMANTASPFSMAPWTTTRISVLTIA